MFSKLDFQLWRIKLSLLQEILFHVNNVKRTWISIVWSKLKKRMMKKSKFGNVNFVTLKIMFRLKMKRSLRAKLSIIFWRQLHKFKIKKLMVKKIYRLFSVLINQVQCVVLSLSKVNILLKEIKSRNLKNLINLEMDLINFCKVKEMLLMLVECNVFRQQLTNRSLICKMVLKIESLELSRLTIRYLYMEMDSKNHKWFLVIN